MSVQHRPIHPRQDRRRLLAGVGVATLSILLAAPAAAADQPIKNTPNPIEETDLPGCHGNLNATFNHGSGIQPHGKDSKGPGYYFRDGQLFQEVRAEVWPIFCGPGAGVG